MSVTDDGEILVPTDLSLETAIDMLKVADLEVKEMEDRHRAERVAVMGRRKRYRGVVATLLMDMGLTGFSLGANE